MNSIKNFLFTYYKEIIGFVIGLFILYWFIYFTTPKQGMSELDKYKIEQIDNKINDINMSQKKLDSLIVQLNKELVGLNKNISTIKNQKIIIKEIYNEKINSVDKLTNTQIDSFFANRYR